MGGMPDMGGMGWYAGYGRAAPPLPPSMSNLKKEFSGRISRRIDDGQGDRAPNPARRSGEDPS
jgi:hypothetical protein